MARSFIESGDRESLIAMLTTTPCPNRLSGYEDIEFYLAWEGKRMKDPILILGEAYSKCRVPEIRHQLAGAVRRAFADLGIRGKGDADYVKNAMQWYEKEKDHLTVNRKYEHNGMFFPPEAYEETPELYESPPPHLKREPLFDKKPVVK
jgi:hypothetical protein